MKVVSVWGAVRKYIPAAINRRDLKLFRKVAAWDTPTLDRVVPALSRSADFGALWLTMAAVMGVTGGRSSKRAALRGVLNLTATSLLVNLPLKLMFRRKRPPSHVVPPHRLMRLPKSHSFPSGHSATAFAFATGVVLESPKLGLPLMGVAGGVAFSRVYTGVHFPGDVLAGSAIGTGVALSIGRLWRVARRGPAAVEPKWTPTSERPAAEGEGLVVVINKDAGGAIGPSPADRMQEAFPRAVIKEVDGEDFGSALEAAAAEASALAVSGGDGSAGAAAKIALERSIPLALIPSGTLNHLAVDLGITSLSEATSALESGAVTEIDVASIDGHLFLNTASIGLYPDIVKARERLEARLGKWGAVVIALARVLRDRSPLRVKIDGKEMTVWSVFFGNCKYQPSGMAPAARERLDDGLIDVRVIRARSRYPRARLMLTALAGRLSEIRTYEEWTAKKVEVESADGPLRVACDGEVFEAGVNVTVAKKDERLQVYVPL